MHQRQVAMSWEGTEEPAPEPQQQDRDRSRSAEREGLLDGRALKRHRSSAVGVVKVLCNDERSQLVNFGELSWSKEALLHPKDQESRPSWEAKWEPAPAWKSVPPPPAAGAREVPVDSFVDYRRVSGSTAAPGFDETTCADGVDQMVEVVKSMPPGTSDAEYSISFLLPQVCDSSEFLQHLEQVTGAAIKEDNEDRRNGERRVQLQGPLMRIYAAHLLMIKRAGDLERVQQDKAEGRDNSEKEPSVKDMQQQVLELQKQLKHAKGGDCGGKGKSSKGKGDGKGKMKCKGNG